MSSDTPGPDLSHINQILSLGGQGALHAAGEPARQIASLKSALTTKTAELEALRAELEACRRDASRYKYLRDQGQLSFQLKVNTPAGDGDVIEHCLWGKMHHDAFDKAVDAAMEQLKGVEPG